LSPFVSSLHRRSHAGSAEADMFSARYDWAIPNSLHPPQDSVSKFLYFLERRVILLVGMLIILTGVRPI
jgi:hypothetical protein